jgi:zinc protease
MTPTLARGLAPVRTVLGNGAVVLVQETAMAPAVTINAAFHAGSLFEPRDLAGVSHFLGRVIDWGTERRSGERIAEELDDRGVALRVTSTRHVLALSCTCLSEDFDEVLSIVVDVARRPTCPDDEVAKRRAEILTTLRQDEDNPSVRAVEAVSELLYGIEHPYGGPAKGSPQTLERISRSTLIDFHRQHVRPSGLSLAIVGDVHPARAIERAASEVEDWSADVAEHVPVPPPPAADRRQLRVIEMPGKPQADIAYGFTALRRLDPRYYAYAMMNNILGQFGLGGRLADNIRERQGMAYYAFSSFDPSVGEGPLLIRAGVDPVNVGRALDAIDHEVRTLAADGPTLRELNETREYLVGSIPRLLETNDGIALFLQSAEQFGLGLDYDRRLPEHFRAVTIDDVAAAAAELLRPERAAVAIAGPAASAAS